MATRLGVDNSITTDARTGIHDFRAAALWVPVERSVTDNSSAAHLIRSGLVRLIVTAQELLSIDYRIAAADGVFVEHLLGYHSTTADMRLVIIHLRTAARWRRTGWTIPYHAVTAHRALIIVSRRSAAGHVSRPDTIVTTLLRPRIIDGRSATLAELAVSSGPQPAVAALMLVPIKDPNTTAVCAVAVRLRLDVPRTADVSLRVVGPPSATGCVVAVTQTCEEAVTADLVWAIVHLPAAATWSSAVRLRTHARLRHWTEHRSQITTIILKFKWRSIKGEERVKKGWKISTIRQTRRFRSYIVSLPKALLHVGNSNYTPTREAFGRRFLYAT